jgi:dTDP-4-amino-4,6-dideoxygalactose transaminase
LVFDFIVYPLLRALDVIDPGSYLKQTGSRDQKMIKKLPSSWFDCFSSLQARIGLKYLKKVVGSDKERIKNVNQIKIKAPDVNFPKEVEGATNVYWVLIAYFNQAVKVQSFFQSKKVDTATSSLELISLLSDYPYRGNTPNAQKLHDCGLFIPAHAGLSTDQIDKVAEVSNKAALAFE